MTTQTFRFFIFRLLRLPSIFLFFNNIQAENAENEQRYESLRTVPFIELMNRLSAMQDSLEKIYHGETPENYPKYVSEWQQLINYAKQKVDKKLEAAATFRLLHVERFLMRLPNDEIIAGYEELALQCRKINFPKLELKCYAAVATLYFNLGNIEECYKAGDIIVEKLDKIPDKDFPDKAEVYNAVGSFYYFTEEYKLSIPFFHKAIASPHLPVNYSGMIQAYNTLGLAFSRLNQFDSAKYYFEQIVERPYFQSYRRYNEWKVIAATNIARVYMKEQKYAAALPILENSVEFMAAAGNDTAFARQAAFGVAECYIHLNNIPKASLWLEKWA